MVVCEMLTILWIADVSNHCPNKTPNLPYWVGIQSESNFRTTIYKFAALLMYLVGVAVQRLLSTLPEGKSVEELLAVVVQHGGCIPLTIT